MHVDVSTVIAQMAAQLEQLGTWLTKATDFATTKKFDPNTLLTARLAPDQFPLLRQIGAACDSVKLAVTRLTGIAGPVFADDQTTLAECQARIAAVVAFVRSVGPDAYASGPTAKVVFPWMPGKYLTGPDYVVQFLIPNFQFHLTHAYALLRHNGVDLGKADFLGALTFHEL
ncbi:MAG: DUF1993 domain-containing protein [Kofleriaceae bacterium]|jgi:hypothetical protein|nr:DUF1993 domain-containing protein [Kofleriaceae bacterium]MBP9170113.1 DUF1993 domain-containing protein [Kofleriaceae bacterium]MBP9859963.1 DUF1993 domain-containing protein [Kofleriaceae bacterium]